MLTLPDSTDVSREWKKLIKLLRHDPVALVLVLFFELCIIGIPLQALLKPNLETPRGMRAVPGVWWLVPLTALIALGMARRFFRWMKQEEEGTELMQEIAGHVR
ncbi:MAG: hypothetical protein ACO3NW_11610, partial [Kiritimatiellia bacterium]